MSISEKSERQAEKLEFLLFILIELALYQSSSLFTGTCKTFMNKTIKHWIQIELKSVFILQFRTQIQKSKASKKHPA